MRLSKYGKKTVSVILACAMFGTSFAQCAFAEDAADMDVVIEQETQTGSDAATEVEADEGSKQEDAVIDASDELVEDQDSSEESVGADKTADVADEAAEEEPSLAIESISTLQGPMIAPISTGEEGLFKYEENDGNVTILGLKDKTTALENLVIPDKINNTSVTKIGPRAFAGITFSGSITFPKDLKEIDKSAFEGCTFEEGLNLSQTKVETIGESAFAESKFTGSLIFSMDVKTIGTSAFKNCTFTGNLKFPSSVTTIDKEAFAGCTGFDGTLQLEESVTTIGDSAFAGCVGFTSLSLNAKATKIGDSAFAGCTGLTGELTIPKEVTEIGANAFSGCAKLTKLTLSSALTSIGDSAFEGCTELAGSLTIPDSVTEIGNYAFENCAKLTALTLPKENLKTIGNYAFNGCSNLAGELVFSSALTSIGAQVFNGCSKLSGGLDLSGCNSLNTIGEKAFYGCSGFDKELKFPSALTEIGQEAFYGCSNLTGGLDLKNCSGLTTVGSKAFGACDKLEGDLKLPEGLSSNNDKVKADAFFDSICMTDGESALELQLGGTEETTLHVRAGNNKLVLGDGIVEWSSGATEVAEVENNTGKVTAISAGTAIITAKVKYNGMTATKKVTVNAKEGAAPTVKTVTFDKASVLKPGTVSLELDVTQGGMGIKSLSGYFCRTSDSAQKITFSFDWSKDPKYSGTIGSGEEKLTVNVPSGAATGLYCLGGMTLTDMDGKQTVYEYSPASGVWINKTSGNVVSVSAAAKGDNSKNELLVKDGFGSEDRNGKLYITNEEEIDNKLSAADEDTPKTAAVIAYDANNHTAKGTWFDAIGTKDVMLVLTNGIVEWGIYGEDIKSNRNEDLDCLVTLAKTSASLYGGTATAMSVKFAQTALPEKATLRIRADQMNGLYQQTNKIYVYTVDETSKKLTDHTTDIPVSYVLSGGQYWYEFTVTSDMPQQLLMSGQKLSLNPIYKVTSIKLNATKLAIAKGKTATLTATVAPTNAANKAVTWKSSNKRVVKVSASGKITAKGYGTATITATAKDGSGKSAKCKVTVGYKIKYKLKGGKNNAKNPAAYYNQKIRLKNPTRAGYKFKGWYTDRKYKHRIKTIPKSYRKNLTLYAKWKKR